MWYDTVVDVRYADTDQMGVVHHSVYACYCEIGRSSLVAKLGIPYHEMEASGIFLMVASMESRFKAPARFGRPIQVSTRISRLNRRLIAFEYRILDIQSQDELFTGKTTHIFTRRGSRATSLPDRFLNALSTGFQAEN